jgi:hypothetical protein
VLIMVVVAIEVMVSVIVTVEALPQAIAVW